MKENTPTPHISASYGQIAKTVIMPGDPLRSKMIAETFLQNPILVNDVRGVQGYSGTYNGKPVTVMASGMGAPSMGIYSYELFRFYDVDTIIRVGSAGAYQEDLRIGDLVIGEKIVTDTNYDNLVTKNGGLVTLTAPTLLVNQVDDVAHKHNIHTRTGTILSTDTFYDGDITTQEAQKRGYLAVEMEGGALYQNAKKFGKNAIVICTISDCPLRNEKASSLDRQNNFVDMIKIALDLI